MKFLTVDTSIDNTFQIQYDKSRFDLNHVTSNYTIIDDIFVQKKNINGKNIFRVFKVSDSNEFQVKVDIASLNDFTLLGDIDSEYVVQSGRINEKYYYILTQDNTSSYYLYFLISPNYVIYTRKFGLGKMDIIITENEDPNDSKTMTTYISDFNGKEIKVYSLDVKNDLNDKYLGSFTARSLNLPEFCPFNMRRGNLHKNLIFVANVCGSGSNIIQLDISQNKTNKETIILVNKGYKEFELCPSLDQFILTSNNNVYGVRSPYFPTDQIYYELGAIERAPLIQLVDYDCFMDRGVNILVYQTKVGRAVNFIVVILKGGGSFDADKRVYKIYTYGSDTESVCVQEIEDGIMIIREVTGYTEFQLTKVRLSGPKFTTYADIPNMKQNNTKGFQINVDISSGHQNGTLLGDIQIVEPVYIPDIMKNEGFKWNGNYSLNSLFTINGPFYGFEIWSNGLKKQEEQIKKIDGISVNMTNDIVILPLGAKISRFFNFTTGDMRSKYIIGYSIDDGTSVVLDKDFNLNNSFVLTKNCSCGDHAEFGDKIIVGLICDINNIKKLVTFYLDLNSSKFQFLSERDTVLNYEFGEIITVELFKTTEDGPIIIKLDKKMLSIILSYNVKVDLTTGMKYEYLEISQFIQNCKL